jgi:hypothetical protein
MKTIRGGLFFLISGMWILSCSIFGGTPMLGHERCLYMPTVEDCQSAADLITDKCLRDCVIDQCRRGQAICGAEVVALCAIRSLENPEGR